MVGIENNTKVPNIIGRGNIIAKEISGKDIVEFVPLKLGTNKYKFGFVWI